MGKTITLLVLLGAGYGVYWFNFHQTQAFKAYVAYCHATKDGDCSTLNTLVTPDGPAKAWVDGFCSDGGSMTVMGQTIRGRSAAAMAAELASTPEGAMMRFKHSVQSEEKSADGSVKLLVIESLASRRRANSAPDRQHNVTVKQVGEAWKVVEFVEKDLP